MGLGIVLGIVGAFGVLVAVYAVWDQRQSSRRQRALIGDYGVALDRLREELTRGRVGQEQDGQRADEADGAGGLVEEQRTRLARVIARLPDQERRVVMLKVQGLTPAEIAAELRVTEGTVHNRLRRAYRSLAMEG